MEAGTQFSVFIYTSSPTKNDVLCRLGPTPRSFKPWLTSLRLRNLLRRLVFSPLYINETNPLVTVGFLQLPQHGPEGYRSGRQGVRVSVKGLVTMVWVLRVAANKYWCRKCDCKRLESVDATESRTVKQWR